MINSLLSNSKKNKLYLLHSFYRKHNQSANELAESLSVSPRSINRYIFELNEEIAILLQVTDLIVLNNGSEYVINPELPATNTMEIFYKLKLCYLKQSPHFQLLVALTTNYKLRCTAVSDKLFISSSYLYRLIKETNQFLKPLHIRIHQTKHKEIYLQGGEFNIRLFAFLFLSDAFQSLEWPFTHVDEKQVFYLLPTNIIQNLAKRSSTKKKLICYLYAIIDLRIKNGQLLTTRNQSEQEKLLTFMLKYQKVPVDISHLFHEKKDLRTEEAYLNFFVGMFVADIVPLEQKQKAAAQLWRVETQTTDFARQLTIMIHEQEKLNLSPDKLYIFFYHIVLFYGLLVEIKEDITPYLAQLFPCPYEWMQQNVESQYLYPLIDKLLINPSVKKENVYYLCGIAYTLCQLVKEPSLRIYLQITKDFMGEVFIHERLRKLFNPAYIQITDDVREADLIISDAYERSKSCGNLFFMDNLHDEKQWLTLFALIQTLVAADLFI